MQIQTEMFPQTTGPAGFRFIPGFISPEEEKKLLSQIRLLKWQDVNLHGVTARRKVIHYGFEYHFSARNLKRGSPPPPFLTFLIERVALVLKVPVREIAEILLTYYPAGAPIGWHLDAPMFESLAGISLANPCVMKLRNVDDPEKKFHQILWPRSAYVIQNEARWKWKHHIPPVKEERWSITFRTLKKKN